MSLRKWCYILPFQLVIKLCLKYNLEHARFLKYNGRIDYWQNCDMPEEYIPDKKGMLYDVNYFMGQEYLFLDDEFTKEQKIKKLETELSKLKEEDKQ